MMFYVDLNTWERREMFEFFSSYELPRFNLVFDLDVTKLVHDTKQAHRSFYLSLMHLIVLEMNTIENFQYRIDEQGVLLSPITHVSFTDRMSDEKRFKMVPSEFLNDRDAFISRAKETSRLQGDTFFVPNAEKILTTVYVTSFPWGKFSGFTHATKLGPKDSVPRISWSQFVDIGDKKILSLSIEVHHALVDGYHVGLLLKQIQDALNR
jgi:chloramphenicol O-acetyltransferase type A